MKKPREKKFYIYSITHKVSKEMSKSKRDTASISSAIVIAESESDAAKIHPLVDYVDNNAVAWELFQASWACSPNEIVAKKLGIAERGLSKSVLSVTYLSDIYGRY